MSNNTSNAARVGTQQEQQEQQEASSSVLGGAPSLAQMGAVVRRWRARRAELARLLEQQSALRTEQRADDARIRAFMERHDRAELPTSAPGPDGRPRQTGTIWLSNARAAPKPITKTHLAEVLNGYDRIDEVTRVHLAAYIWDQREFGQEEVKVNFEEICDTADEDGGAAANKKRRRAATHAGGGGDQ